MSRLSRGTFLGGRVTEHIIVLIIKVDVAVKAAKLIYVCWAVALLKKCLSVKQTLDRYIFMGRYAELSFKQPEEV